MIDQSEQWLITAISVLSSATKSEIGKSLETNRLLSERKCTELGTAKTIHRIRFQWGLLTH